VNVPRWLLFLVAAWVIAFGLFRIFIALRRQPRSPEGPNFMRRGLYARTPRSHVLFGGVYLVLGAFLIATGFGWAPAADMGGCLGKRESTEVPDSHSGAPAGDSAGGK
jgi:hypothetical protein